MFEASIGKPQHHENLTLFPILAQMDRDLQYLLMADALASGALAISEKGSGEVPVLVARNASPQPILVLDGEQLVGARQNRMTNRSILLPPMSTLEIPVSCMEHGRWHFVSDGFASAPHHAPSKVRRKPRETEVRVMRESAARGLGERSSHQDLHMSQGEVWHEIREMSANLGSESRTGALDALYAPRRDTMERWIEAFPLLPLQVGLVVFLGNTPLGMDAVGSPGLFAPLHRRILTGYILDAMEGLEEEAPALRKRRRARTSSAPQFVEAVRQAARTPSESVGLGEYRVLHGSVLGGELVNQDHTVHLSAFPLGNGRSQGDSTEPGQEARPIARPSHRRRRF